MVEGAHRCPPFRLEVRGLSPPEAQYASPSDESGGGVGGRVPINHEEPNPPMDQTLGPRSPPVPAVIFHCQYNSQGRFTESSMLSTITFTGPAASD